MRATFEQQQSMDVITLEGRLDAASAPELRKNLDQLLDAGRTLLIFDLERVDFVDSSGLSVFVNALQGARRAGGEISIAGPTSEVQSVLELTRLHKILPIFDDRAGAEAAMSARAA
ncbi:MAG: STAS domain-containing protein [Acidobacteriota bacterium]